MIERTVTVTKQIEDLIYWVGEQDPDEIRQIVRENILKIKEDNKISQESRINNGFKWDDALEPNDGPDQWNHGGDCNLCRKAPYCRNLCRANRLLTKIATPLLYQKFLDENPEKAVMHQAAALTPDKLVKMLESIGATKVSGMTPEKTMEESAKPDEEE